MHLYKLLMSVGEVMVLLSFLLCMHRKWEDGQPGESWFGGGGGGVGRCHCLSTANNRIIMMDDGRWRCQWWTGAAAESDREEERRKGSAGHLALKNSSKTIVIVIECLVLFWNQGFSALKGNTAATPCMNYASTATSLWTATFTNNVWWKQTPRMAQCKNKSVRLSPASPCDRISVRHTQFTIISYLLFRRVTNRRKFCPLNELIVIDVFNVHLMCILWPTFLNHVCFQLLPHLWTIISPYLILSYFTLPYGL